MTLYLYINVIFCCL